MGQLKPIFGVKLVQFIPIIVNKLVQIYPSPGKEMASYKPITGVILGQENPTCGISMGILWSMIGFGSTFPILGLPKKVPFQSQFFHSFNPKWEIQKFSCASLAYCPCVALILDCTSSNARFRLSSFWSRENAQIYTCRSRISLYQLLINVFLISQPNHSQLSSNHIFM